ncbi:unnamed protein product [Euphydryas editha]|uniref:Endonuclease/exonuclease/phosphatase domain-containing protein n=1 Tax=Euphydryas editha TaxID=104508 RepID=A0AAU9UQS3_EUPED|nr:unnamed protein product [Euphydryas editha]
MTNKKSERKNLRFGLLNARSLNTGKDELLVSVLKYAPDILAINETWIKTGEEVLAPAIPNYRFLHRARQDKRGGGVGFYIRQDSKTSSIQHPPSSLEQMWLQVKLPGVNIALGTAYRPESVGVLEAMDALDASLNISAHCDFTCILGDFNIDVSCKDSPKVKELLNFCHHHSLEQLVQEPTRVTDSSQTILDLVITDNSLKCKDIKVIHNNCLSDHALVLLDLNVKKPKIIKQVKYRRTLNNIDIDAFNEDLNSIPWEYISTLSNVDEMVYNFNRYLITLFDIHAPIRKLTIRDKPKPWITDTIKLMMSLRDEALMKARKEKNNDNVEPRPSGMQAI